MNQFEGEALRLAAGMFVVLCIAFSFLRSRLGFWSLFPRMVMFACLGWFVSSLIVIATLRTSVFEGLVFTFAYFAVILLTPPLLAAGMFEVVLGTYATFTKHNQTSNFPARWHFIAALSTFTCFGTYFLFSAFPK